MQHPIQVEIVFSDLYWQLQELRGNGVVVYASRCTFPLEQISTMESLVINNYQIEDLSVQNVLIVGVDENVDVVLSEAATVDGKVSNMKCDEKLVCHERLEDPTYPLSAKEMEAAEWCEIGGRASKSIDPENAEAQSWPANEVDPHETWNRYDNLPILRPAEIPWVQQHYRKLLIDHQKTFDKYEKEYSATCREVREYYLDASNGQLKEFQKEVFTEVELVTYLHYVFASDERFRVATMEWFDQKFRIWEIEDILQSLEERKPI